MGVTPPLASTCLDLTISVPGSYSTERDGCTTKAKSLIMPTKLGFEDNWINIGCPKRSKEAEEHNNETNNSIVEDETGGVSDINPTPRKKLRLSKEQSRVLEDKFNQNQNLNPKQKEALAEMLSLKPRQVEVWFQNRRARCKLNRTAKENESLKHWLGSLTEENRKLQKELKELRAVKLSREIEPSTQASLLTVPNMPASVFNVGPKPSLPP